MADTKISALTDGDPAQSGDQIPVNRGGVNRRITVGSIAALASGLPLQLPIQDGLYYGGPTDVKVATGAFAWDSWGTYLFATPFIAHETKTWEEIGLTITTGDASAVARLGIFADNGGTPAGGALIVDAGEISAASTGDQAKAISQALVAGTPYWKACAINEAAAACWGIASGGLDAATDYSLVPWIMGRQSGGFNGFTGYAKFQAYAALPATFPTDLELETTLPFIWLRTGV
jgi:hypothetical protein